MTDVQPRRPLPAKLADHPSVRALLARRESDGEAVTGAGAGQAGEHRVGGDVHPVDAVDQLSDEENTGMVNGLEVRKGSVAAFIANLKILESLAPTDPGYPEVEAQLRALAPAVRAVGVFDVLAPRSATIAAIVGEDRLSGNAAAGS